VQVVDHLRDRVRTYEVVNEPNNWIRADYPALDAPSFARVLARVYTDVKLAHRGDPCWQVTLVSGALFAFRQDTGVANDASSYLDETYRAGIATEGWTAIHGMAGTYPLDGVGYHIYLPVEDSGTTASRVHGYVDAVRAVM